jgi:phage shock protein A
MTKLATALRGGVRESAEVIIDANSLRIFSQEIHECENHITHSKHQLASIIAEKKRVEREIDAIQASISQYEKRMADYLQQDDEASALKLAQQVSEKEAFLERNQQHCQKLFNHEQQLQQTLQKMINRLDNFRSEYRMAQATGKMQNAQGKLANRSDGALSRFGDMQDSLSRIRERQQQFSDEMEAMDQIDANLSGFSCIDEAVLKTSAKDILARVKRDRSK